ncbi:MAG: DNA topology modulation protein [Rubrobacteraceae bacterium]
MSGLREARRVLIVGAGGSGKSTLAVRLGELLNLEIVHLDQHYWSAGWKETPREEWEYTVQSLVRRESWVMDGNYGGTMDLRLAAADTVIFLDLSRNLYLRRVLVRRLRYAGRSRPDMPAGCPERLTFEFLKYLWKYPTERRPGVLRKLDSLSPDKTVFVLRSPTEIGQLVSGLEKLAATQTR